MKASRFVILGLMAAALTPWGWLAAQQPPELPQATTDAQGNFLFPQVPPGKYKLSARAVLHNRPRTAEAEVEVPAPPAAPKPLELQLR